jgi:hypothetical protein
MGATEHRSGDAVITIVSYVHLFRVPLQARAEVGLILMKFRECVISPQELLAKAKQREYLNWPLSFA